MGVRIATGVDDYYDEKSIDRISIEVEYFVQFGMLNFDALQTATVNSAPPQCFVRFGIDSKGVGPVNRRILGIESIRPSLSELQYDESREENDCGRRKNDYEQPAKSLLRKTAGKRSTNQDSDNGRRLRRM